MSMKTALKMTALAAAIAATAVPMTATAEVSGSLGIANTYLWRGMDLSAGGAQVHGSLDYAHETGLYAGVWGSSETDTTEYDVYAGFAGEAGGLSYDIAYVDYNYPNDMQADFEEAIVGLGFAGVSLTGAFGVGKVGHDSHDEITGNPTKAPDNEDNYYNISYTYDKYTAAVGMYDKDADEANYTHLDLSYALTDELSFTLSKVVASDDCADLNDTSFDANGACVDTTNSDTPDDTLFVVSYSFPL